LSKQQTNTITAVGLALLIIAAGLAGWFASSPGGNPAAMLGIIASTSVGIERSLEVFWTIAGQLATSFWPLTAFDQYVAGLDNELQGFVDRAVQEINAARAQAGNLPADITQFETAVDDVRGYAQKVSIAVPPSQQEAADVLAAIDKLRGQYPALQSVATDVNIFVSRAATYAESVVQNPARKLISLYAGAVLGVIIAGLIGMDLFKASGIGQTSFGHFDWGVVGTGLIMGLGSNPAHEVIKAIQEFKSNQRTQAAQS
jgi:hypothetical protein